MACDRIIPPPQWRHKPTMADIFKRTVAIALAQSGIIPPDEWAHDPRLCDCLGSTVFNLLKPNGIDVPKIWLYKKPTLIDCKDVCMICLEDVY